MSIVKSQTGKNVTVLRTGMSNTSNEVSEEKLKELNNLPDGTVLNLDKEDFTEKPKPRLYISVIKEIPDETSTNWIKVNSLKEAEQKAFEMIDVEVTTQLDKNDVNAIKNAIEFQSGIIGNCNRRGVGNVVIVNENFTDIENMLPSSNYEIIKSPYAKKNTITVMYQGPGNMDNPFFHLDNEGEHWFYALENNENFIGNYKDYFRTIKLT